MAFICVRLDSSAVGIEPAVHIRQEWRAGRLAGMLVVVAASVASGASEASSAAAAGDKAILPLASPLRQNSSLENRKVHTLESKVKHS